ncbi:guanylyl cyclase-activating protein 2 [Thecamonas trahens ATCC 50062]|uniref:Guanylyl cyclase-activating protein 2 n=1 Tax=Thecamonas trahens ATCC 50062 TaxID=461836 RepID=A0A0L0D720_THETB|nr:guanylyl cyclase-activating protein 2 [Thecamonas trahens ATCC 50062]KNC48172.1 guanylyl cyclase-activating protein 2 [Thecamonas trahens ATCC 50062]|eukprot:XP_013758742.1 guanylyl cyclase-activating protein 2 [Thecamonas trahens ATCC 50062]
MGNRSSSKKHGSGSEDEGPLDKSMAKKVMKATKLDQKEVDKLFFYFQELAALSGGSSDLEVITKEVFVEHCLHLGTAPDTAELFFRIFDVDGSNSIDFQELAMYTALVATGTREAKIEATFKVFDSNGDGRLSRDEVAQMLRHSVRLANALCMPVSESMAVLADTPEHTAAQVDAVFATADEDHDGVITLDEFKTVATINSQLRGVLDFFYYLSNPKLISVNQEKAKHIRKARLKALEHIDDEPDALPPLDLRSFDEDYDSWDSEDDIAAAAAAARAEGRYDRLLAAYVDQFRAVTDRAARDAEDAIYHGKAELDLVHSPDKPIDPIIDPEAARARASKSLSSKPTGPTGDKSRRRKKSSRNESSADSPESRSSRKKRRSKSSRTDG